MFLTDYWREHGIFKVVMQHEGQRTRYELMGVPPVLLPYRLGLSIEQVRDLHALLTEHMATFEQHAKHYSRLRERVKKTA